MQRSSFCGFPSQRSLVVALALLALVQLAVVAHLVLREPPRPAFGQSGNGQVVMETLTRGGGSEAFVFIYDSDRETLSYYLAPKLGGLELKGIRRLTWDLQVPEYPKGNGDTSVLNVKKGVQKAGEERGSASQSDDDEKKRR